MADQNTESAPQAEKPLGLWALRCAVGRHEWSPESWTVRRCVHCEALERLTVDAGGQDDGRGASMRWVRSA